MGHSVGCAAQEVKARIGANRGDDMAANHSTPRVWSEAEDHYLLTNITRLSPRMIGEDLGRTECAVGSRIKKLRGRGKPLPAIPAGRRPTKGIDFDANRVETEPALSDRAERKAMRDEVQAHLRHLVATHKLSQERATEIGETISQSVLQAPEWRFQRYAMKPVAVIVQEAA